MSGAVTFPVQIGAGTYTLTFKFGVMRVAEQELGRPFINELSAGQAGLEVISCLFWAALRPKHAMTRDGADNLIDEAGIAQVGQWIGEGVKRYFGSADEAAELADGDEPAKGEAKPGKTPAS